MKVKNIIAEGTDAAQNLTSNSIELGDLVRCSIHVIFQTTDITGTLFLDSSNDGINWVVVDGSSQAVVGTATPNSADHLWNIDRAHYRFVRARWVYTSNTGTFGALAILKENVIKGA